MTEPRLIRTVIIDPGEIDAKVRMRPVYDSGVEAIMSSAREIGIKDAIDVREIAKRGNKPKHLKLIAGGHRLEAAKRLGVELPVKVWHCTNDQAELMEIDDNIGGAGMNALDTAVFLARRKAVYERMHPEAAAGVFKGNQHTGNLVGDIMSFTTSTAEQFNLSKRHVERLIKVGAALADADINALRRAPKPVTLTDLITLAKVGEPAEREAICTLIGDGMAQSVSEARKAHAGNPAPVKDPIEEALNALKTAWDRAGAKSRRRFLRDRADDIAKLQA